MRLSNLLNQTPTYTTSDLQPPNIATVSLKEIYRSNGTPFATNRITVSSQTLDRMIQTRNAQWMVSQLGLERSNQVFDLVGSQGGNWARASAFDLQYGKFDYSPQAAKATIQYRANVCQHINHVLFRVLAALEEEKAIQGRADNTPLLLVADAAGHVHIVRGDRRVNNEGIIGDSWVGYPTVQTYSQNVFQTPLETHKQYTTGAGFDGFTLDDARNAAANPVTDEAINGMLTQAGLPTIGPDLLAYCKTMSLETPQNTWNHLFSANNPGTVYTDDNGRSLSFCDVPRQDYERISSILNNPSHNDYWDPLSQLRQEQGLP